MCKPEKIEKAKSTGDMSTSGVFLIYLLDHCPHLTFSASRDRYEKRYEKEHSLNFVTIWSKIAAVYHGGNLPLAQIKICLLGAPLIELDGKSADFDTRKAIALLAYLAVTQESHTRDSLATLLWPELDQSRARAALRRTLSALKSAVGDEPLAIERDVVGLSPSAEISLDVDLFLGYLDVLRSHGHSSDEVCPRCLAPLSAAAELYRDDFLAGFTLRDSPSFDDWQFFQTDEFRRKFAFTLEKLVLAYAAQEEYETAIEYAHRWLALDQLQEIAHRQLMKLYVRSGRRNLALRQYRECVRILSQELGVSPLEETVQLYEAIRDNRLPAEKEPTVMKAVEVSEPPLSAERSSTREVHALVGRARETRELTQVYDSLEARGHFIVITGEAGIGKTRLAEELLAHAWTKGAVIIQSRCYEGETDLSYEPFVEGLRSGLDQSTALSKLESLSPQWLAEAARLLPELFDLFPNLPDARPLEGPGAQTRLFEAIAQFLLALCEGPVPGILFIDDLHWADAASLGLLAYLVRRVRRHPLLILGTWRAEVLMSGNRLDRLLGESQRAETATQISLSRLTSADVRELVETISQPELPHDLSKHLFQETEGLPFFVVEYLTGFLKAGSKDGTSHWALPGGVRDLLHSRLQYVDETGWQILTTAAVMGRSFDFDILRSVGGRSEEETVSALEDLVDQGLVQEVKERGEGREINYDFNHEKLRAYVYEQTSLARRRLLHRRVAEQLLNRSRFAPDPGQLAGPIAHHLRMAGEDDQAAEFYRLAGEHARQLYAHEDALKAYQTALALGHPQVSHLNTAIGDLQTLLGDYPAALSSYETAASTAADSMLPEIEHRLGNVHHRLGEWGPAESHFRSALDTLSVEDDLPLQSMIYADWSLSAHNRGDQEQAQELAGRALRIAEGVEKLGALAQVHNLLGILARGQDDLSKAQEHLQQSLELSEAMANPWMRVAALNNLALVYSQRDEIPIAISQLKTALSLCISLGDRHREAALHNNLADLYHATGSAEESMSHLKQAVRIYAEIGEQAGSWQPEIWKLVEW